MQRDADSVRSMMCEEATLRRNSLTASRLLVPGGHPAVLVTLLGLSLKMMW